MYSSAVPSQPTSPCTRALLSSHCHAAWPAMAQGGKLTAMPLHPAVLCFAGRQICFKLSGLGGGRVVVV